MVSRRPTSGNSLCTAGSRRGPEGAPRAQRRVGLAARPRGPRPPSGPGRPPGAPSGPRAMPPRPASAREPTRRVCERPVADLEALEAALAECALSSSSTPDLPRGGPPSDLPCGGPPPGVPPLEGSLDLPRGGRPAPELPQSAAAEEAAAAGGSGPPAEAAHLAGSTPSPPRSGGGQ
ncbi:unnamed protein product, partial [Prorocentrum cordatum]